MKNQYFGDDRDVFKYDLARTLVDGVPSLHRFTFIPMLTPPDDSGHGDVVKRSTSAPGSGNSELVDYLDSCRDADRRNIAEISKYFNRKGVDIPTYIHKEGCFLDHYDRSSYFEGLDVSTLESSLVFLDPDNGLEIQDSSEKHLLLDELRDLYERMGDESVLMFFQYRPPFKKHSDLVLEKSARLYEMGIGMPLVVAESDVSFFLFTKDRKVRVEAARVIAQYCEEYPQLRIWNI